MKTRVFGPALVAVALFTLPSAARAQKAIFVVRHAEKVSDTDERLSDAGRARAARLAQMLKDSGITAVYATDTERARDTVAPLAGALGLKVAIYDTGGAMSGAVDARPFAAKLRKDRAADVVLIAGHSNTLPDLLKALGCAEAVTVANGEYDNLFVVVPKPDGTATLVRLRY
ncbi:MAG TPA: histidine phosphatase family protein [Thermoanaerobaculia bacterium]